MENIEASCVICRQKVYVVSLSNGSSPIVVDTEQQCIITNNRQKIYGYKMHT